MLIDDDLSDLNLNQKLELLEIKQLAYSCPTTQAGMAAGFIVRQDEFDRRPYEDFPILLMVIHEDGSYTVLRKTRNRQWKTVNQGKPIET